MRLGILAKKIGMSRFYDSGGINHPVTIVKIDNSKVVDIRTIEKNGYNAICLSYGDSKKAPNKITKGFLKKKNLSPFLHSREFRVSEITHSIGDKVGVNNFVEGQFVDVSANSIGKGFAGGMKRHNFSGNRATHGVSISHRSHGSTGQCQDPGKVFKGKKMAGRLGNVKVTTQNLKILKVDHDNNLILIRGAVPGHKGSLLKIFDSIKKKQDLSSLSSNQNSSDISKDNTQSANNTKPEVETSNAVNSVDNPVNQEVISSNKIEQTVEDSKNNINDKAQKDDKKWNKKLKI